jgi:hypothetical protein
MTKGDGVDNPPGDFEIFALKPNGNRLEQLTFEEADDYVPTIRQAAS